MGEDDLARKAEGLGQEGLHEAETLADKMGRWVKALTSHASPKVVGIAVIGTLAVLLLATCG